MVALMREFPQVKLTFNLVPSLLVQLEAFAEGPRARLAPRARPEAGGGADRERARDHPVGIFPRAARPDDRSLSALCRAAAEARQRRGIYRAGFSRPAGLAQARVGRSVLPRRRPARPAARRRSSAASPRTTKLELRDVELEILRRVIPEYREAAERGQVELSTSPFYHPILPLLCDTDIYLEHASVLGRAAARRSGVPRTRRSSSRGRAQCHQRLFGHEPAGLWPSEGSVSDEMAELAAKRGLPVDGDRRGDPRRARSVASSAATRRAGSSSPNRCTGRIACRPDRAQIACLFRDHALSDLIGFVYAGWQAEAAAADFVNRLVEAGRRFSAASGGEEATISDHPRRRERVGALRGRRAPVPARALRQAGGPSRAATRDDERGGRAARGPSTASFPGRGSTAISSSGSAMATTCAAGGSCETRVRCSTARRRRPIRRTASRRSRSCSSPKAATGSGGTATTIRPTTTSSSTSCSAGTCGTSIRCSASPCPRSCLPPTSAPSHVPLSVVAPVGLLSPVLDGRASSYFEWLPAGIVETDVAVGHHDRRRAARAGGASACCLASTSSSCTSGSTSTAPPARGCAQGLRCSINFTTPPTAGWS